MLVSGEGTLRSLVKLVSVPTKCMKVRLLVRFELREFTFSDCYMGRAQFGVRAVEGST